MKILNKITPKHLNNPGDKFESTLLLPFNDSRLGEGGLRTKGYYKHSLKFYRDNWHLFDDEAFGEVLEIQNYDYDELPLVSIITVVFNGEKYLEKTIQSIFYQNYPNIEFIIIDGGSKDKTLDIIKKYDCTIDYWVSERDNGIYDAMNKGLSLANGIIIGIVNSDDWLYPGAINNIVELLKSFDYTYGPIDLVDMDNNRYGVSKPVGKIELNTRLYKEMPFNHLSLFVKRKAYKELGGFNSKLRLSADYDFIIRLVKSSYRGIENRKIVGAFRSGGKSGDFKTFLESRRVLITHNVSYFKANCYFLSSMFKIFLFKFLPKPLVRVLRSYRKSRHEFSFFSLIFFNIFI